MNYIIIIILYLYYLYLKSIRLLNKSLQEIDLPIGWLTTVNQPNSHNKEKRFVQGVERTIPLKENPAQLDYPNALNVVRQDTFIVCVGVLLIMLKLGQEVTLRTLIVTVTGSFWELLLKQA